MKKLGSKGFTVVEVIIVLVVVAALILVGLDINNKRTTKIIRLQSNVQQYTYVNNMPLPVLPSVYILTHSDTAAQSLPSQDYLTRRSASQSLTDMKSLCNLYGFSDAGTSGGPTTENGVSFMSTTLQCYKGNDGWQFNINSIKSLADYEKLEPSAKVPDSMPLSSTNYVNLVVMSIGPPTCNSMTACGDN